MELTLQAYFLKVLPEVNFKSAQAVIELAAEGATVPFIARYRKEKTGNLDETQIRQVIESNTTYNEIIKRKAFLIKEIGEQGNLTDVIKKRIQLSYDLNELEDIYKPFKKKKKTKATIARDAGLEPLSQWIWDVGHGLNKDTTTLEVKAKDFLNVAAGIATYDLALKGAQDIIIEKIANEPELRAKVLSNYMEKGKVISVKTKNFKPHSKYEMYADYKEDVKLLHDAKASHRYMAMRRGWQEEELTVEVKGEDDLLLSEFNKFATTTPQTPVGEYLIQCAKMAYNVYVVPSVTNEVHRSLKDKSDTDSILVFAENVRKVLLASPYGPHCVLGVDPGLRTGCKIALIDKSGHFISHTVMQLLGTDAEAKATKLFNEVTKQIKIDAIAVGNGTAGRQAEIFIRKILKEIGKEIPVIMVSESGASVYSASEIAKQEFPDLDVTVRGAISIARRLQDPLSELVKVDPKSIGVGQYQHDVNQSQLKKSLEAVVESCVNNIGVDLNTSSAALLSYVSGIGPALAQNIVEHRKTKGLFTERDELLKIPKFSTKVYEQAAGFLRIQNGKFLLDQTGIHPERYQAVRDMSQDLGVSISDIIGEGAKKLLQVRTKWAQLVGEYTFDDIYKELEKPGRDPRNPFKVFQFREDIFEVSDLKEGMICPGIVTNVTNFGAFVDIGVHQDGLVHISALANKFVDDPRKVVNPGDQVTVKVISVDLAKNQIALSMRMDEPVARAEKPERTERSERPKNSGGANPNYKGRGDSRPQQRDGGGFNKGGGDHKGKPAFQNNKPAAPAFNNPFAALLQTQNKK